MRKTRLAVGIAMIAMGACALEVLTYPRWRVWCLHWGALQDETDRTLPGDELLEQPDIVTTRGINIDVPATSVWPWLIQMGPGRAGAYTYDWVENLAGLDMPSADELIAEFQHLQVGDSWKLGPRAAVLRVASVSPGSSIVLRSDDGNWVWAFVLVPETDRCRLTSRNRIQQPHASHASRAAMHYIMESGSLVMERKMLLGIKERAERTERTGQVRRR
jgi:hypothetical protein